MGFSVYDQGGHSSAPYVATLIADAVADLDNIPKDVYAPGTAVLVLADSTVYMLNTTKTEWVQLAAHNSNSNNTNTDDDDDDEEPPL